MKLAITQTKNKTDRMIYLSSLLMITLGTAARMVAFWYNRSLFIDEAYLASSVVQRGYGDLFRPLDFVQGAPIGFLCLAKTFVYLFGSSEYSLRLLSLLSGIGSIALFYLVLKVLGDQRPYIGTAFFATIPFLIDYSIEFKPYMFDGFVTLLSVYVFSLAVRQQIKTWVLCLYCALVLWFSFPAIFTVAAFCIVWAAYSAFMKQGETMRASLITGVVSMISFGLLLGTAYQNLQENQQARYWSLLQFPLVPRGFSDFQLMARMGRAYLSTFDKWPAIVVLLISGLAVTLCWSKKRLWFGIFLVVEIALLLTASWLGRYAIVARLLIFVIPLHILFISGLVANLWSKHRTAAIGLSVVFVLVNVGSAEYFLPQNVFRPTYEINPIVNTLESLDNSIPLYVYVHAIPQYEYKTGYRMGLAFYPDAPIEHDDVIYGSFFFRYLYREPYSFESEIDSVRLEQNVRSITTHDQVYLLFVTYDPKHRDALIAALEKNGGVGEIMSVYETPLYLYQRNP